MGLRDPVSSATHLLTAVWAAYATLIMIRLTAGNPARRLAVAVFGVSMVLLYLASGTFHGLPYAKATHPDEYRFFQKLDQTAIFLIIAGTNTPIQVVLLGWRRGRWFLLTMWLLAAVGIACLWLLPRPPYAVTVGFYLTMGWLGGLPLLYYVRAVGWRALTWAYVGGVAYTLGAVLDLVQWPVISTWPVRFAHHEIFHLCDMLGSLAFFLFVMRHVIPYDPPAAATVPATDQEPVLVAT